MTPICELFLQLDNQPDPVRYLLAEGFDPKTQVFESMIKGKDAIGEMLLSKPRLLDGGES